MKFKLVQKVRIKVLSNQPKTMLYRPSYTLKKIKWEFNPYDNDFNERWSVPHGDDVYPQYHTLKLDVDTGEIFTAKGHLLYGKLPKSELKRLNEDSSFKRVKKQAIEYRKNHNKYIQKNLKVSTRNVLVMELKYYKKGI